MLIKFLFVWKTKEKAIKELEEKYLKLISGYCKYEIEILKEEWSIGDVEKIKILEWNKILEKIKSSDFLILLDAKWKEYYSEDFAKQIMTYQNRSLKLVFIIAWAYWSSDELRNTANQILSFSKMTFTHEMVRIILFEQIFRAFSILKNTKYHK